MHWGASARSLVPSPPPQMLVGMNRIVPIHRGPALLCGGRLASRADLWRFQPCTEARLAGMSLRKDQRAMDVRNTLQSPLTGEVVGRRALRTIRL